MSSISLELPHNSSGEVDWNTLGNILSARILGEVLQASYVDKAYGKPRSKDFVPDTDWKFIYKEDDVVALQKSFPDSPIKAFMGRGVIDRPMEDIVHFLENLERRKEWDKYLQDIQQVKAMSEKDFILYMKLEARNCLVRYEGDFVEYERMAYTADERYVRTVMSVELPEIPLKRNVIRGELHPGTGWVLEHYNGSRLRTLVSWLAHVDLKGLPPVLVNRVMRQQPKAVHRIRKILTGGGRKTSGAGLGGGGSRASPLSDSFTSSEKKAVLAATLEYNQTHFDHQRYEEGLSIEEFTGRREERPRRFLSIPPVLSYNPETDSFSGREIPRVRRTISLSGSSPLITAGSSGHTRNCDNHHHHCPASGGRGGDSEKGAGEENEHLLTNGREARHRAATEEEEEEAGLKELVEVSVHSDARIPELTGFERDSLTSSISDTVDAS